ncbi:N-acyl-D-amino-acid deacylase family protein [Deinococcus roseus]|uniref:Dihydroorotase n=1 Tax=Deinococcus roseus TaxID=392414 RepID=A0ABQ2DI25_9DEIO|nr:D-aminoacylase [Deinococcus roseus]GGJ57251.1 dihydroorotase [Deinococcus roseus]
MLDVLIRQARVIDGTSAPWFVSDVGLENGKIVWLGPNCPLPARQTLDATHLYLSPGWIDSHTHDDTAVLLQPDHPCKSRQGITTVVVGNCSFSNYPLAGDPALLMHHYQALLGTTAEHLFFADFQAYQQRLNQQGAAVNVVSLVGHAALRLAAMGYSQRPASPSERLQMCQMLETQLQQGAFGLSLGLVYPPGAYADSQELLELAQGVARNGALLTAHVRSYEGGLLESVHEFLDLLEQSGARGLLSHLQAAGAPNWGKVEEALTLLETARARGIDVSTDMYPYPAGSSSVLQLLPPSAQQQGLEVLFAKLSDPAFCADLQTATEHGHEPGWESKIRLIGWENVQISSVTHHDLKPLEGKRFTEAADLLECSPFQVLLKVLLLDRGTSNMILFQLHESDLSCVMKHRLHMLGSDSIPRAEGKAHPRTYGSFPRLLGRMVKAGLLPLEEAVRKVTSLPAQRFGLWDRGLIRPGMQADLCLFSEDLLDQATFQDPEQPPVGLHAVWVNGVQILQQGGLLGNHPGRMLSHNLNPSLAPQR